MFTVTLIGPDGVGKTTVSKQLRVSLGLPVKYLYMGMNPEASNVMLPTTRWWENRKKKKRTGESVESGNNPEAVNSRHAVNGSDSLEQKEETPPVSVNRFETGRQKNIFKLGAKKILKAVGLVNRLLDIWYRQLVAWIWIKRGYIVLFDRHYSYDYYHRGLQTDNENLSLKNRIHDFVLKHTLREPDLLIILDAPGQVVFDRKGEFTPEFLETRRNQYLELQNVVKNSRVLDATQPLATVVQNVEECIQEFYRDSKANAGQEKT